MMSHAMLSGTFKNRGEQVFVDTFSVRDLFRYLRESATAAAMAAGTLRITCPTV